MAENNFDLIVIGSGPGGYVAAIRAAQNGMSTCLVEKDKELGGTCLNVGCIPSKALLHSTEMFAFMKGKGGEHGFVADGLKVDVAKLMEKKSAVVAQLNKGVRQLVEGRKITVVRGTGRLGGGGKVVVDTGDGEESLTAKHIVIATGSVPVELPFLKFDDKVTGSSDDAIAYPEIPGKLVVVGGGAIGLELGSVWARLGSEVTVVELLPQIAPTFDEDVSKMAQRIFKKQGMKFELGAKVTGVEKKKGRSFLTAERGDKKLELEADRILVAVGRKPNTRGLSAGEAGVELDKAGRVIVDEKFRTSVEGVYAIGDVIRGPMLAHKAEEDGVACVDMIAGKYGHVDYDRVPNVIYTDPEIAGVGMTEKLANERGVGVKVGKFPLVANGRAIASDATDGFVKVVADEKTDKLLGVFVIARNASELIAPAVAHMEYGGSAEDMARTITAHPTLSESLKEAALAVNKQAIHAL